MVVHQALVMSDDYFYPTQLYEVGAKPARCSLFQAPVLGYFSCLVIIIRSCCGDVRVTRQEAVNAESSSWSEITGCESPPTRGISLNERLAGFEASGFLCVHFFEVPLRSRACPVGVMRITGSTAVCKTAHRSTLVFNFNMACVGV